MSKSLRNVFNDDRLKAELFFTGRLDCRAQFHNRVRLHSAVTAQYVSENNGRTNFLASGADGVSFEICGGKLGMELHSKIG